MVLSISQPQLLTITDEKTNSSSFGGIQEWYPTEWGRRAGCGPTCAANVLAYLALTRPELRPLYGYDKMTLFDFEQHMEDVYKFVTPGAFGLNRSEMFSDGVAEFARNRDVKLTPHVFSVSGNMSKNRPDLSEFVDFTQAGLASDCPLGFLNLSRGRVKALQSWHWITISAAEIDKNKVTAWASDEGSKISFDLSLWYLSTRLNGGLVYFT